MGSNRRLIAWLLAILFAAACAPPLLHAADAASAPAVEAADAPTTPEDYELLKLFADTLDQVERNYVKPVDRRELLEAAIRGMLGELDPHSTYIPPAELERFKTSVENEFGGIGVTVTLEEGELKVVTPLYGSPAYRAGLRAGDSIVEIDGEPTKDWTVAKAVQRVKGKIGTSVKVTVKHAVGGENETVEVSRSLVRVDSVLGDVRNGDDTWNYFLDDTNKIGYLRLTNFSRHTPDEVRTALGELSRNGMQGLILDLRFNPGGLLTAAIEVSDLLVAEGRIVSTSGRGAPQRIWDARKEDTFEGFPIVVLVNRFSASASEIVAACLQDHGRARIAGERTWGKGSVQNIIELEDGKSALKLTTAGYLRPSGKNIHRDEDAAEGGEWGVRPDAGLELKLSADEIEAYHADRQKRDAIYGRAADGEPPAPEARTYDKQLQLAYDALLKQLMAKNQPLETAEAK
jgi:carboxyl-terminal processing protease